MSSRARSGWNKVRDKICHRFWHEAAIDRIRVASIRKQNTNAHQGNGFFCTPTHVYCVLTLRLRCRSHGRNPTRARLAMHRVHLGVLRSRLAMGVPKGVSTTVEAAAIGRWETDWKAQVQYTVLLGSAEFVAQMHKLLRGDRDQQRQDSSPGLAASPFVVSLNASRAIAPSLKRSRLPKRNWSLANNRSFIVYSDMRKSALIVPNAPILYSFGQNTSLFCLLYLYRRDPFSIPFQSVIVDFEATAGCTCRNEIDRRGNGRANNSIAY
jgi:hypothetical protein